MGRQTGRWGRQTSETVIRLIHITDPHLSDLSTLPWRSLAGKRWSGYLSWHRRRRFVHRRDRLDRLTRAVHALDPVQILVTGDLVHIGLPAEVAEAAQWLESLGTPERVTLVPGNHDVYARDSWGVVSRAWGRYLRVPLGQAAHGEGFPTVRDLDGDAGPVRIIGLSSARPSPLFMASGRLGNAQLERLEAALDTTALRCVLIHHPPLPGMTSRRKGLDDAPALAQVLARRGAELVLHGHVHRNAASNGPGGLRVFGTASASAADSGAGRGAALRCFDVSRGGGGYHVDMRLLAVDDHGALQELERQAWDVAAATPASAASAVR